MKHLISGSLAILSISILVGCSTTSQIKPYTHTNSLAETMQQGVVFSLPKTLLEVKITYSLYEKVVWPADAHGKPKKTDKDGNLISPKSRAKIVVVDKPVEVNAKIIPDQSARFIFDPNSVDGFTKDIDITLELTSDGMLKSTNIDVKDKTKEIISNVTGTIFNLAKIAAVAGEDAVELTLIKDLKVTRIIDPSVMEFKGKTPTFVAEYSDAERSEGLFDNLDIPEVVVTLTSPTDIKKLSTIDMSKLKGEMDDYHSIDGFPYRTGSPVEVIVKVDDQEIYDAYHNVAQGGGLALIPVNAKSFSNITQGLSFGDDGSSLRQYKSKGTSQGEAISLTAKDTTSAILTGLQGIEQTKLDKIKKEKELLDAEETLKTAEKVANIQAQIDLLKKEKELIDAELALQEAKKKKEGAE